MAPGRSPSYRAVMFGIEHRKGSSIVGRETSKAASVSNALRGAVERARTLGADNIRVCAATGEEITIVVIPKG